MTGLTEKQRIERAKQHKIEAEKKIKEVKKKLARRLLSTLPLITTHSRPLCAKCKQNIANQVRNGVWLCEKCAKGLTNERKNS